MHKACLVGVLAVSFLLGFALRGEADDAKPRPSDADVQTWVAAIRISRGPHATDLLKKLSSQSDRAIPLMYERIQQLWKLEPTLTVCDVRDIRDVVRPKLPELEALLTKPSIKWYGDGKLIVRCSRVEFDKVGSALDQMRAAAANTAGK